MMIDWLMILIILSCWHASKQKTYSRSPSNVKQISCSNNQAEFVGVVLYKLPQLTDPNPAN